MNVNFNERGNRESQKHPKSGDDDNNKVIYEFMACMSSNDKISSKYWSNSSQLTNWILDFRAICHLTPHISDFIPGSL